MKSSKLEPQPPSRKTQKLQTRQTLKDAARRCFAKSGWQATSVGTISEAAGVAHGTFYVHFPSKEALMDELVSEFNQALALQLAPVWSSARPSLEAKVRRTAELFLDYWTHHRAFVRASAERLSQGLDLEAMRDGVNPPAEVLVRSQLARLLAAAGAPDKLDALLTQGLLALWLRIGLQALFNPEVRRADAVLVLTRMTLGGIAAVAAPKARYQLDALVTS